MKRTKRWLAGLLCAVLLVGLLPAAALAAGELTRSELALLIYDKFRPASGTETSDFGDIADCSEDEIEAIEVLGSAGIISGENANFFGPEDGVARWQAAMVLYRAMEGNSGSPTQTIFTDVTATYDYRDPMNNPIQDGSEAGQNAVQAILTAVNYLVDQQILTEEDAITVDGEEKYFDPNGLVTVGQVETWLSRVNGQSTVSSDSTQIVRGDFAEAVYTDETLQGKIDAAAEENEGNPDPNFADIDECSLNQQTAIITMAKAGILSGYNVYAFRPEDTVTYQVAALILCRAGEVADATMENAIQTLTNMGIILEADAVNEAEIANSATVDSWLDRFMTRAELAKVLYDKFQPSGGTGDSSFEDIGNCTAAQQEAIQALAKAGMVSGVSGETRRFMPNGIVTNIDVAMSICRIAGEADVTLDTAIPTLAALCNLSQEEQDAIVPNKVVAESTVSGWLDGLEIEHALSITPSRSSVSGSTTISLTVEGAADAAVNVTCTSHADITVRGSGSAWTVSLPNASATYTFTASAEGYAPASCAVTVRRESSSNSSSSSADSGNVSGSGEDVSVSASDGSVSASQMESAVSRADSGTAITVDADRSTSTSLPVSGMANAVENDNAVTIDLQSGEVTLSVSAIAGLTDGAGSDARIEVSVEQQTSSQDEAIVDLLDSGAAVFDVTIRVDGDSVHRFDGRLTITLTVPNLSSIADPHVLHILADGSREYYQPDRISGDEITVEGIRNLSTFAVIPGSEVPTETVNPFADISESAYYYNAVLWAVEQGVTEGSGDGTFAPDLPVSRAQAVTFLWRAAASPEPVATVNAFADVSESVYYYKAVLWAVGQGVTNGTGAAAFSPDTTVSRAQMVTFLWRAAGSPEPTATVNPFTDISEGAYYYKAVLWAVEQGITEGNGDGTFAPNLPVSRAQGVTFLYRNQA